MQVLAMTESRRRMTTVFEYPFQWDDCAIFYRRLRDRILDRAVPATAWSELPCEPERRALTLPPTEHPCTAALRAVTSRAQFAASALRVRTCFAG